ncbi:domain-containing 4-like [Octopus vulgaris]|uniref:Domain-containing 4-like n=2 Tax=Octopus TaxID=6643 RepID=A0AA36F6E8_OCTVU|nr:R3H domain-containing protein 4 [Octopus sinensis]CAI9726079.1 domain-containing 4-like [Octopus vulgaris]
MGINRDSNRDYYDPEIIEDDLVLLDTVIECPDEGVSNIKKPSRLTKYHSSKKLGSLYTSIDDLYVRKKLGANKSRRCENLCYLLNLVDKDDWGNLEKIDRVEPRRSVFAEILMDKEKWKVWNDFINQSEEEQQKILQKSNSRNSRYQRSKSDQILKDKDLNQENWEIVPDMRAAHPAHTAEQCFQKLDRNIRATLKRRHFPQGLLLTIEEDLISFFKEWPTAVYISQLANSFERLLLHALCQYLGLKSKSFEEEGIRRIEVENSKDYFRPPNVLLSQYIQKNQ